MAKKKIKAKLRKKKPKKKKGEYHTSPAVVSERDLICELNEDLQDAWKKLRAFGVSLGDPRIYASHRSIMFSRKVCFFFVRPKKSFLEVWFFLPEKVQSPQVVRVESTSKTKFSHLVKIVHADQIEEPFTDWLRRAYEVTPPAPLTSLGG